MGTWDDYCLICGGPLTTNDLDRFVKNIKDYLWLNKLLLILSDDQVIQTNDTNYEYGGIFEIDKKIYNICPLNYQDKDNNGYGFACHQDCYKLIQINYKHDIKFHDVSKLLGTYESLLKTRSKYKPMDKYNEQFFNYETAYLKDPWLLESPFKNNNNKTRILNIWKSLIPKFKKNKLRPSPTQSATLFEVGKILLGNNKKLWIVKKINDTKRWIPYNKLENNKIKQKSSKKTSKKISKKISKKNNKKTSKKSAKKIVQKLEKKNNKKYKKK
ncbi:hypothetical protein Hokovirus_1_66 [Hokovirus HKV1]|uniref:Uncharacterized protein n=1 Tax=Hokovirus HKV1 TaxID=1977638 RepID=A0A1V0SEN6_9VIRU|nr:hypothetical protein Hokovirus_1_66 [Hokovirus HKV1]